MPPVLFSWYIPGMKKLLSIPLLLAALLLGCAPFQPEIPLPEPSPAPAEAEFAAPTLEPEPSPAVTIEPLVTIEGEIIDNATEALDLSGLSAITNFDSFLANVGALPALRSVDLTGCFLPYEQMDALFTAYPDIQFIFTVRVGDRSLRTDATAFSMNNPEKTAPPGATEEERQSVLSCVRLKDEDLLPLKFCTELVALELGHNDISDLSVIGTLSQLQILILSDNRITDLSPLKNLSELLYLELYGNDIVTLAPLSGLDKLIDLNIAGAGIDDFTPLYGMGQLERLWYASNPAGPAAEAELAAALPGCDCQYLLADATGGGWREHERYKWMRGYFEQ